MNRAIASFLTATAIRPSERVTAARVGAGMWVTAALSVLVMAFVLPGERTHRVALVALAAGGCVWAITTGFALPPARQRAWLIHLSTVAAMAAIGAGIALSGGSGSPVWACLFYVVVFTAYFMRPPAAAGYFLGCVLVEGLVVAFSAPGTRTAAATRLVIAGPAFVVLGGAVLSGKRFMWSLRADAERLAAEQGALRRVATGVVNGISDVRFHQLVAVEAAGLVGAHSAGILRLTGPQEVKLLGAHGRREQPRLEIGERFPIPPGSEIAEAMNAARPVRTEEHEPDSFIGRLGYRSSIVAPISVGGRAWGCLIVVSEAAGVLTADHERRLTEFAALIAASVTNIEDRATLAAQAATDPLTGVANHRTFHERLAADLARARRYGSPVAVAMIDVDHFKEVNDAGGHEAGDDRLIRVARCLADAARAEDTLARIGGDEFAWILPETTAPEAVVALERVRRVITDATCQAPPPRTLARREIPRVTISAGVCDSSWSADPTELVRLADQALYASKENGRDQVRLYVPPADAEDVPVVAPRRRQASG